jgi:hypothetical protein
VQESASAAQAESGRRSFAGARTGYRSLRERTIRWKRGFLLTTLR